MNNQPINWHQALNLYFIAGTQDIPEGKTIINVLKEAIQYGITCFQYREKGMNSLQSKQEIHALANELLKICRQANIPFIINDDLALAIEINVDAIHVGQSDLSIQEVIKQAKLHNMSVGLSINTKSQMNEAAYIDNLDYVGVGPVFATTSKSDAEPPLGVTLLSELTKLAPQLPKVAIGGINQFNVKQVRETGVNGVAIISAITQSQNIKESIFMLS